MTGRFKIVGRVMESTRVKGYWLFDSVTNTFKYLEKPKVDQMALSKMISNCTAQNYQGTVTLKGTEFKIQSLPKYDTLGNRVDGHSSLVSQQKKAREINNPEYKLAFKIINSKQTTGYYDVQIVTGKKMFMTKDEVIQLALNGKIKDVRAVKLKDRYTLRGINFQVDDLPAIQPTNMGRYMGYAVK